MTDYFVDPVNGNDADDGLSWADAFLTLNGAEDEPVAAGDRVFCGPGVYRELLTCDVSGGNTYSVGTVDVTNGSDQVIGNGTTFGGNVAADYYLHIRFYDSGADGVTNGTLTFTAAGGNFDAAWIGLPIQINTRGAYTVGAVGGAGTLTLVDTHGLGNPAAAGGLSYSIMSGEGHYEIESQDDNTTLTLKQPWQGKTVTAVAYLTFNAIKYIADVTGEQTDGVGGIVRITGSDNDQTAVRNLQINVGVRDYRMFRGFSLDSGTADCIRLTTGTHAIFEDMIGQTDIRFFEIDGATHQAITIRRCGTLGCATAVFISSSGANDDTGHVIENCHFYGGRIDSISIVRNGGITIRNCIILYSGDDGVDVSTAPTTGQTIAVYNSLLAWASGSALEGTAVGEITENYNNFYGNNNNRTNVTAGANSQTYPLILLPPIRHAGEDQLSGFRFPHPLLGELSEWSQIAQIAGVDERNTDLLGIRRPNHTPAKNSWGPFQFPDSERETGTVRTGSVSIVLHDAARHHIWVPVTNVSTTISVWVYREANYAGTNPQLIIKQPGQADDITTDAAAASQWNELTTTLTPAALPPYVVVELVSNNTNGANDDTFFDDLTVS